MTVDTWDRMRAGNWDVPPGERLPTLLALIGAAGQPLAEQQDILRQWMTTAPYNAAPDYLKAECRSFLERSPELSASPVTVPVQQARWQKKLDEMFPGGAISTWDDDKTAPVSWIRVVGLSGLNPVLAFYYPFVVKDSKVLVSLTTDQAEPHLIATARFDDGSTCQLTAAIPDGLKDALAKDRAVIIAGNVTPA